MTLTKAQKRVLTRCPTEGDIGMIDLSISRREYRELLRVGLVYPADNRSLTAIYRTTPAGVAAKKELEQG